VRPEEIVLHHTPGLSAAFHETVAALGVRVREVKPHPSGIVHCNKVQQLRHRDWPDAPVVLCDSDLVWVDTGDVPRVPFAAKVVDRPRPPENWCERVFREAGHTVEWVRVDVATTPDERTPFTNLNGGLYIVGASVRDELGEAWNDRVTWLVARPHLLAGWHGPGGPKWPQRHAVDQMAMALALPDLGIRPLHLDRGWNFPTHFDAALVQQPVVRIKALHHHDRRHRDGRLASVGIDWVDEAITRGNQSVEFMRERFRKEDWLLTCDPWPSRRA
jgi:hypothetical protein